MYRLLLLLLLATTPAAAFELTPHEAEYKLKISVLGGRLTTRLVNDDGVYRANHVIKPTGMSKMIANGRIDETSEFRISDDSVLPLAYRTVDELSKDKSRAEVRFDAGQSRVSGTVNGGDIDWEVPADTLDRVAIQYQLMLALAADDKTDGYTMYDVDELKTLEISFLGERSVKTRAGTFDAVGVRHQRTGSSRETTLWCVPELDFLPVLIEQHRKGKLRMRASLERYTELQAVSATSE